MNPNELAVKLAGDVNCW